MALPAVKASPVRVSAVRATAQHAAHIAYNVREADREELWRGWRHTPEHALKFGLRYSSHVWTGIADLKPFCMVGVVPQSMLGGSGAIWLIATDAILAHQVGFLRRCKPILTRLQLIYSHLWNDVAADNAAALRWLRWMHFVLEPARPLGPDGALFHRFSWSRPDV